MNQGVEELLQAALALSDEEQLQFVAALVAAVDERGLRPFDDSWIAEAQRRSAEYDAGLIQANPWSVVKERARQKASLDRLLEGVAPENRHAEVDFGPAIGPETR